MPVALEVFWNSFFLARLEQWRYTHAEDEKKEIIVLVACCVTKVLMEINLGWHLQYSLDLVYSCAHTINMTQWLIEYIWQHTINLVISFSYEVVSTITIDGTSKFALLKIGRKNLRLGESGGAHEDNHTAGAMTPQPPPWPLPVLPTPFSPTLDQIVKFHLLRFLYFSISFMAF